MAEFLHPIYDHTVTEIVDHFPISLGRRSYVALAPGWPPRREERGLPGVFYNNRSYPEGVA